jgi:hypothetical protein
MVGPEYATLLMHEALRLELLNALAAERRRNDDLRLADGQRWMDGQDRIQAQLSSMASEALRVNGRAETTAANLAIEQKATAANLAEKVDASALALRVAVEASAKAMNARIEPLEQARYENAGRQGISTPLLMALSAAGSTGFVLIIQKIMGG